MQRLKLGIMLGFLAVFALLAWMVWSSGLPVRVVQ